MGSLFGHIFAILHVLVSTLAYIYFAPPEEVAPATELAFFRYYVNPIYIELDKYLGPQERLVGRVVANIGEHYYKGPNSEKWSVLTRGSKIYSSSEIKSSKNSQLQIKLIDNSDLKIFPESHVAISAPSRGRRLNFDLKAGAVWAHMAALSKDAINLSSGDKNDSLEKYQDLYVVAPLKINDPTSVDAQFEEGDHTEVYIGAFDDDINELKSFLLKEQKNYLRAMQSRILAEAKEAMQAIGQGSKLFARSTPGRRSPASFSRKLKYKRSKKRNSRSQKNSLSKMTRSHLDEILGRSPTSMTQLHSFKMDDYDSKIEDFLMSHNCKKASFVLKQAQLAHQSDHIFSAWRKGWRDKFKVFGCR